MMRFIACCCLFEWSVAVSAEAIEPQLYLLKLTANQTSEQQGDELYIDVTVYPSKGKATHFQVPQYPLSWPSRALNELTEVKLWGDALKEGESVTLIVSLVEQDSPPWDTDDLIGSLRVRLKNNAGDLESTWSVPNRTDAPVSINTKHGPAKRFHLTGDNSRYEMILHLKEE
mgnify:CR=1 FL=1